MGLSFILPSNSEDGRSCGRLFATARIQTEEAVRPARVLEILYCEQCGTTFFGGSRLRLPSGQIELLSTDPDIEGIPDRQAARFVDKRSFNDFAIFWPSGKSTLDSDARPWTHPDADDILVKNGERVTRPLTQAQWQAAYLDPFSAKVMFQPPSDGNTEQLVSGYLYTVGLPAQFQSELNALPAVCPCCARSHTKNPYRKSPVRSFRTGFSKLAQILSKEIFYNLPRLANPKLVVFSDSREDAASVANGIERNHYNDLVREALYDELASICESESSFLQNLRSPGSGDAYLIQRFEESNPGEAKKLRADFEMAKVDPETIPEPLRPTVLFALQQWTGRARHPTSKNTASRHSKASIDRNSRGEILSLWPRRLIERLRRIGINPAGNDLTYQTYRSESGNFDSHWTSLFPYGDATSKGWTPVEPLGANVEKARVIVKEKVRAEITRISVQSQIFRL